MATDLSRISSITTYERDRTRGRKIRRPSGKSRFSSQLFVNDCITHDPGGVVAPVELKRFEDGEWVSLGIAKCCPLCWMILQPPAGASIPEPISDGILAGLGRSRNSKGSKTLRPKRTHTEIGSIGTPAQNVLNLFLVNPDREFTVTDLIQESGHARATVLKSLKLWITQKKIIITHVGSTGRGNPSKYKRAP